MSSQSYIERLKRKHLEAEKKALELKKQEKENKEKQLKEKQQKQRQELQKQRQELQKQQIKNNETKNNHFNPVEVKGEITNYATVFNVNYVKELYKNNLENQNNPKSKFKLFSFTENKDVFYNQNDLEVYHLECLNILDLNQWNNSFKINKTTDTVDIDYESFLDVGCTIQKNFLGTFNFTGKSFTTESLMPGDFQTYYFQYLAFKMFKTSLAFYGIQNLTEIKKEISKVPNKIIKALQTKKNLENLYETFRKRENEVDESGNIIDNQNIFRDGDILEFSVLMKKPNINILASTEKLIKKFKHLEKKIKIDNSLWKIYFIFLKPQNKESIETETKTET